MAWCRAVAASRRRRAAPPRGPIQRVRAANEALSTDRYNDDKGILPNRLKAAASEVARRRTRGEEHAWTTRRRGDTTAPGVGRRRAASEDPPDRDRLSGTAPDRREAPASRAARAHASADRARQRGVPQAGASSRRRRGRTAAHFFAVAAHVLRAVLVDHARARLAAKRGAEPGRRGVVGVLRPRARSARGPARPRRRAHRVGATRPATEPGRRVAALRAGCPSRRRPTCWACPRPR